MTTFYDPDTIDALRLRADHEPCTCILHTTAGDPEIDTCLRCLLMGLQPTVEAFEPVI